MISLKAVSFIPTLLLQKRSKSLKAKGHLQALARRMKLWDKGNIEGLLYEGMTIQQRIRSDKGGMTIAEVSSSSICWSKEMALCTYWQNNMHNRILPLTTETLELLVQKLPGPRKPPDISIHSPTWPVHPVTNNDIDETIIAKALVLLRDIRSWCRQLAKNFNNTCRRVRVNIILGIICHLQTNSTGQKTWAKTNWRRTGTTDNWQSCNVIYE